MGQMKELWEDINYMLDKCVGLEWKSCEEIAKEYVTKVDVHLDINRVLDRLDRMEQKLDMVIKESRSAIS